MVIDGPSTIELDAVGNITLDSAADIELNADGGDVFIKDGSSIMAQFQDGITTLGGDGTNASRIQFNDADDSNYIKLEFQML